VIWCPSSEKHFTERLFSEKKISKKHYNESVFQRKCIIAKGFSAEPFFQQRSLFVYWKQWFILVNVYKKKQPSCSPSFRATKLCYSFPLCKYFTTYDTIWRIHKLCIFFVQLIRYGRFNIDLSYYFEPR